MNTSPIWLSILLILAGYLVGSIPSAYLAGKWIKGIDLRNFGSGTISGSMVWEHVSKWAFVLVAVFDILKATFATWLAMSVSGGIEAAILSGFASLIGHNWPIYLNFTGGRGLSPYAGMLLVVFPWGVPWMIALLAVGYLLGDSAPWALASLVSLPLLVNWTGGAELVSWSALGMVLVTLVKRLEANGRPIPEDARKRSQVIWLRLLFDRDIPSHQEWIRRKPGEGENKLDKKS